MDHCHRQLADFDYDFRTRASKPAKFRWRPPLPRCESLVMHGAVIPSFLLVRFSFQSVQQFAPVLLGAAPVGAHRERKPMLALR
jgi:hypothetical protein